MLALMCRAAGNRYAFDSRHVTEVVSYVRLQRVPAAPEWMAGLFAYRGRATPVIDLTYLASGGRSLRRWSSRILVVPLEVDGARRPVGLLVEGLTTAELAESAVDQASEARSGVSAWGPVLLDEQGMYQLIELPRLLSADRRRAVFSPLADEA